MLWNRFLLFELFFSIYTLCHFQGTYAQINSSLPVLKIGLIADPQYCDCDPSGGKFYRETLKKLPEAIDTFNKYNVDFVVTLGDLTDRGETAFDSLIPYYHRLNMPFYNVLGNHEFAVASVEYFSTLLHRYEMSDYYYDFSFQNWRFLVLDGTELASYSRNAHLELGNEGDSLFSAILGQRNDLSYNGGIGIVQRAWMRKKIQEAMELGQNVILFCHFPVYPETLVGNLWNSYAITDLIDDYPNVTAYISGHYHLGAFGQMNGIHYITQKAMVNSDRQNSYSILEIYDHDLYLKGFGAVSDTILPYTQYKYLPDF